MGDQAHNPKVADIRTDPAPAIGKGPGNGAFFVSVQPSGGHNPSTANLFCMERAEAEAVYDAGREACVEFLVELTARYERQVTRLEARIERLEEKLRENSQNSSRPPSADPPAKRPQAKGSPSPRR